MKFLFAHPHVGAFFIAFFLVDIFVPIIRRIALYYKIVDNPDNSRKIHTLPMPLLGGAAIYFGFLLACISTLDLGKLLIYMLLLGTFIIIMGILDDIFNLSALIKLAWLTIAILILTLKLDVTVSIFGRFFIINLIFTIIWVVYMISCFNAVDNMDGQAAGIAALSGFIFYAISYQTDQPQMGYLAVCISGACFGFLRYNTNPASVFMGDSGSFFIGFTLASIAVMGNWAGERDILKAVIIPTLVLGFPIYDLTVTTILRYKNKVVRGLKEAITLSAKDHVAHRLQLLLGLTQRETVLLIYLLHLILATIGLLTVRLSNTGAIIIALLLLIPLILFGWYLDKAKVEY